MPNAFSHKIKRLLPNCSPLLLFSTPIFLCNRESHSLSEAAQPTKSVPRSNTNLAKNSLIYYKDEEKFKEKRSLMVADGPKKLQIVSDFDFTLTKYWVAEKDDLTTMKRAYSCHRVIEECGLLPTSYHDEAQALQRKYYPLEIDPSLSHEERVNYMVEWVTKAHQLLSTSGLTKNILQTAVKDSVAARNISLRSGAIEFMNKCEKHAIPILIFSAGISDVLEEVLKIEFLPASLPSNLHIVSNRCKFDSRSGILLEFEDPTYHVFNKKASSLARDNGYLKQKDLPNRRNIILLGDSLGNR